jgi:hypothetical protein
MEKLMPPKARSRHGAPVEEYSSFDELAKGVASGTISRSLALKMLVGGGLAALFGWGVGTDEAEAAVARVCRDKQAISDKKCPAGSAVDCSPTNDRCECTKTVNGDTRCVDYTDTQCPRRDECDRNRDCRRGEVCARVGACCGGSKRNLCVPLCRDL